jgi:hypothetical protein
MIDSSKLVGRCLCGGIEYELAPRLGRISHCHCTSCRRAHGAAFVTWTSVDAADVVWRRGESQLRVYESSAGVYWRFCSACGSSLAYETTREPSRIYLTVANIDGPLPALPEAHVSFEERVDWLHVADSLPRYRGKSDEPMD